MVPDLGLMENIKNIYLDNFNQIEQNFIYDEDMQKYIQKALTRLARGDRKRFSICKDINRSNASLVYKILFQKNIIEEERSREEPFWLDGRKNIKKHLRGYRVENKIYFVHEATRFWFNFIAPFKKEILAKDFKQIFDNIDLQKHTSLSFEFLSLELLKKDLGSQNIISSGSFWTKDSEIDLLIRTKDGQVIVGECKYKHTKICKNVLNSLQKKVKRLGLTPSCFALFSKSGFSKEVLNLKDKNLLLYSLQDFERLL